MGPGDAAEFDALYLGTSRRLVRQLFLLTGDLTQAEDVVVAAFERAWLRWAAVRELVSAEAWVRTLARRLAVSRWRRLRTATRTRWRQDTSPDPPRLDEQQAVLVAALAALPVRQRVALVLHHLVELPVEGVAAETGSSVAAVREQLARGRATVTDRLVARLREDTEQLPVTTPRPEDVRRSARLHRRQRVLGGGVVALAAVTVAVGLPLLAGPGEPAPPPPGPTPDRALPPGDPLAAAMLRGDDLTVGSATYDDIDGLPVGGPASFAPLHRCDAEVAAEETYQKVFGAGALLAGQRILVGLDEEAAAGIAVRLERRLARCSRSTRIELAAAGTSDSLVALSFPTRAGDSRSGRTYAVVLRLGRVVSQVVLVGGPDLDPGPRIVPVTITAVRRIRAALPVDAAGGPSSERAGVTTIPASFRFAEEETDAGWRGEAGDTTVTRSRDPDAPWALDPCHPTAHPTDPARTSSLRLTRSGPGLRHNLHLALYRDERTAAEVLAGFRRVLSACARRISGDDGPAATREVWRYQRLAVGEDAVIATAGYTVEDRAVSGVASAAAVRVGNAVFVRVDYSEGLPGPPDPATDAVARSARRNLERICTLIGTCAESVRPE